MKLSDAAPSIYVPILKAKAGEADAISRLSTDIRRHTTPFFDIPSPSAYGKRDLDEQLDCAAANIARAVDGSGFVYVDTFDIALAKRCRDATHPVVRAHHLCRALGLLTIPVTGFDRDDDHLFAVRAVVAAGTSGACIRLDDQDIEEPDDLVDFVLERCFSLDLPPSRVDILLDFRSIATHDVAGLKGLTVDAVRALTLAARFRTITVAASNFPRDVTGIPRDGHGFIERVEYRLWMGLSAVLADATALRFGDYGIVHPEFVDLPAVPNANAKIRYTTDEHWFVVRGHQLSKPPGFGQFPLLANEVLTSPYFCGDRFSYGDEYIARCAAGAVSTGNLRTWVGVDMCHHVHFATSQVNEFVTSNGLPVAALA